jgi:hypothetical protein
MIRPIATLSRLLPVILLAGIALGATPVKPARRGSLDPIGKIHIPIGVPNTVDTLKTFVEREGNFSPGVGSYGIYFWVYDHAAGRLIAPTQDGMGVEHGLGAGGILTPWSQWAAGGVMVRSQLCQVVRPSPAGDVHVAAARVALTGKASGAPSRLSLFVAVRSVGPAGWPIRALSVSDKGDALLVDERPAVVAIGGAPTAAGVAPKDTVGDWAARGEVPPDRAATDAAAGQCSGALRFDLTLDPGAVRTFDLACPVLPGRRAVGHRWDNKTTWAQLDENSPNPQTGGLLQPDPGLDYCRSLGADQLFRESEQFWTRLVRGVTIRTPDPRWGEAVTAISSHAAMAMNEGAPDVTVVNYNVFNRDGIYTTSILHKMGCNALAAECVEYFLAHPFNGRVEPEADNPGQVLWIIAEHWRFTRDRAWLDRTYPRAARLAAMIEYYRTAPEPHWVDPNGLQFGAAVPPERRKRLIPGKCDGIHPEYTDAFDIAGLRAFADLSDVAGAPADARMCRALAERLWLRYLERFGGDLGKEYGSFAVLWPCRLAPFNNGPAYERFKNTGAQKPAGWRYFPLATAHQGLLAGNRDAGYRTIAAHLEHEQMAGGTVPGRGWYAFDEGGGSGPGNWPKLHTTWDPSIAMPHGWAIAELHLLIRDSMAFEDGDRLVLLAGIPPEWFAGPEPVGVQALPTHFGAASFAWTPAAPREGQSVRATLTLLGASPPGGFVLRLPAGVRAAVTLDGNRRAEVSPGIVVLPSETKTAEISW